MNLFIIQPFPSHYYPVFKLAKNHLQRGEKVVFTTTANLKDLVSREGFDFHEFEYLSEYMIKTYKSFFGFLLKNLISDELLKARQKEFETAYRTTQQLIEKYRPTKIYLDQCMADYYFFFKPHIDNVTILHTRFYSGKSRGIPPLNSTYVPKKAWYSNLVCEWKWYQILTKQYFKELLFKIAFLGKDETYFWKRHCGENGMDWNKKSDFNHFLNRGVNNVDNVVLAPKALEFEDFDAKNDVTFFGELSKKNETVYFTEEYAAAKKRILQEHSTVIYLAFGSLSSGNKKVEHFFNQVISMVKEFEDTYLFISKGGTQMELLETKNTLTFDFLPQIDLLSFTDLFITHGGLGSVKEAYHANVPMLVVPLNKKIDQPGNAARVKAANLGDMLNLDSYTYEELSTKLITLLNTGASYVENRTTNEVQKLGHENI